MTTCAPIAHEGSPDFRSEPRHIRRAFVPDALVLYGEAHFWSAIEVSSKRNSRVQDAPLSFTVEFPCREIARATTILYPAPGGGRMVADGTPSAASTSTPQIEFINLRLTKWQTRRQRPELVAISESKACTSLRSCSRKSRTRQLVLIVLSPGLSRERGSWHEQRSGRYRASTISTRMTATQTSKSFLQAYKKDDALRGIVFF